MLFGGLYVTPISTVAYQSFQLLNVDRLSFWLKVTQAPENVTMVCVFGIDVLNKLYLRADNIGAQNYWGFKNVLAQNLLSCTLI